MTDEAMSPLRRRMIEDMTIRKIASPTRAEADKVGRRTNLAYAPPLPGHTLTASSTTARWVRSG